MRGARTDRDSAPADWYLPYVSRSPGIQGGAAVLKGTRTPVRSVVVLYHRTYPGNLDEVQSALPHLSRIQLEAALAYYEDHRAEIDADIERHRAALESFTAAP